MQYIALTFRNGVPLFQTISLYHYESRIDEKEIINNMYKCWWHQTNRNSNNCNIYHLHFCTVITNIRWFPRTLCKHVILSQKKAIFTLINLLKMFNKMKHQGISRMVYACSNNTINGVMIIFPKKRKTSKNMIYYC